MQGRLKSNNPDQAQKAALTDNQNSDIPQKHNRMGGANGLQCIHGVAMHVHNHLAHGQLFSQT